MSLLFSFVLASYASFALRMWNAKVSTRQYSPRPGGLTAGFARALLQPAQLSIGWHGISQHKQCKYICAAGVARATNDDKDS